MDNEELKKFIEEIEKNKSSRVDEKIAEKKSKMWDKLPPTSLPSGELVINTSLEGYPQIVFSIPEKSTDVVDESKQFGIRKSDTQWEIYSVSSGEVIKQSRSYSKFFDGSDWDPGESEISSDVFSISKKIPVTIHEKIDGTIISAKDISYKYPQIFKVEWNYRSVGDPRGGKSYLQVSLSFTIRKDVTLVQSSYSIDGSGFSPTLPIEVGSNENGIIYNWSSTSLDYIRIGSVVSFFIITTKSPEGSLGSSGSSGSSGIGGTNNLESRLTYTIQ
jgi:hypothetical protein